MNEYNHKLQDPRKMHRLIKKKSGLTNRSMTEINNLEREREGERIKHWLEYLVCGQHLYRQCGTERTWSWISYLPILYPQAELLWKTPSLLPCISWEREREKPGLTVMVSYVTGTNGKSNGNVLNLNVVSGHKYVNCSSQPCPHKITFMPTSRLSLFYFCIIFF